MDENLTSEMSLEDFCKSIEFIAPQGTTIDFFITPKDENDEQNGGIENSLTENDMSLVDEIISKPSATTVYIKKGLDEIQNDASGVFSPISMAGQPVVNRPKIARTTDDPIFLYGGKIGPTKKLYQNEENDQTQTAQLQQIAESSMRVVGKTIILEKTVGKFKKGTIVNLR